jgi:hypothetical protein
MKIKTLLTILFVCFSLTLTYASFPVKRTVTTTANATTEVTTANTTVTLVSPAAAPADKNMWVGVGLWFFLGWPFAAHRWYYGKPVGWNILFILTIGGLGIWAIVDLINILTDNF